MTHAASHNDWLRGLYESYAARATTPVAAHDELEFTDFDDIVFRCIEGAQDDDDDFDTRWKTTHPPLLHRQFGRSVL